MNDDMINAKNRSTINYAKMEIKTPENNNYKWNVLIKLTHRSKLLKELLHFNHLTIIT